MFACTRLCVSSAASILQRLFACAGWQQVATQTASRPELRKRRKGAAAAACRQSWPPLRDISRDIPRSRMSEKPLRGVSEMARELVYSGKKRCYWAERVARAPPGEVWVGVWFSSRLYYPFGKGPGQHIIRCIKNKKCENERTLQKQNQKA